VGVVIDHAFIACRTGAPEADLLLRQGFVEGSGNTHPGQGTANRRFFFDNFMLELLWIVDQAEVTSVQTRRTRLWERCSKSATADSPFGIVFRSDGDHSPPPFQTWAYFPSYLPAGTAIEVAEGTTLQEPELFYLPFLRGGRSTSEPTTHKLPFCRVKSIAVGVCNLAALSNAALSIQTLGQLRYFASDRPVLELHFQSDQKAQVDLRPALPLVMCADH
jgi:Glyoxalase-like domain